MNEEQFRKAVKELRERKERERQQQEKDRATQADLAVARPRRRRP